MVPFTPQKIFATQLKNYNFNNKVPMLDLRNECVYNYCSRFGRKILLFFLSEMGYNFNFHNDIEAPVDMITTQLYKSVCMDFDQENVKDMYKSGNQYTLTEKEFKDLSNRMLTDELNVTNKDVLYYQKRLHVKYCNWLIELNRITLDEIMAGLSLDKIEILHKVAINPKYFKRMIDDVRNSKLSYEERVQLINDKFKEEAYMNIFDQEPNAIYCSAVITLVDNKQFIIAFSLIRDVHITITRLPALILAAILLIILAVELPLQHTGYILHV